MITLKTRRNILRILPFGLIWWVFGLVFFVLELGFLGDSPITPSTGDPYDPELSFYVMACIVTPTFGLIIGAVEVFFLSRFFKRNGLALKILIKISVYIFLFLIFNLIAGIIIYTVQYQTGIFDKRVWQEIIELFSTFALWSSWIYAGMILAVCLFYSEISDNIGHGVLANFFTGKYHRPKQEERVFMFLDMKSSTTIAEQLGHVKYFDLLRDFYSDFTDAIINHSSEVYQYVGDEVVITWPFKKGIKNNNCLNCFFTMKEALQNRRDYYEQKYGVVPTFKAGLHYGSVTTGEIGDLKKEIIYTGDILNTTARIQGLCNELGVDILISRALMNKLEIHSRLKSTTLGPKELRGKEESILLQTVELVSP